MKSEQFAEALNDFLRASEWQGQILCFFRDSVEYSNKQHVVANVSDATAAACLVYDGVTAFAAAYDRGGK